MYCTLWHVMVETVTRMLCNVDNEFQQFSRSQNAQKFFTNFKTVNRELILRPVHLLHYRCEFRDIAPLWFCTLVRGVRCPHMTEAGRAMSQGSRIGRRGQWPDAIRPVILSRWLPRLCYCSDNRFHIALVSVFSHLLTGCILPSVITPRSSAIIAL